MERGRDGGFNRLKKSSMISSSNSVPLPRLCVTSCNVFLKHYHDKILEEFYIFITACSTLLTLVTVKECLMKQEKQNRQIKE